MLVSTVVKTDPAGNIKPDKEKSVQKIDRFFYTKNAFFCQNPHKRGVLEVVETHELCEWK